MSTFITGYSLRAPNVSNPKEFYEAIRDKVDLTAPSRRYPEGYLDLPPRAGTLPNIDGFDNEFFKYNIKQTDKMDIIIRLLLEVTHEALLDAKISIPTLRGSRTGVYIGHCFSDYLSRTAGSDVEKDGYELVNGAHAMAANKISFFYDFKGPSLVFDTACSSSLVALHQANQDLKAGLIDRAIVGGASLTLDPNKNKVFQAYSMLSPTGRCHSFDARADGYCRAEGIAVVLLESPSVCSSGLAQVLGSSVNSDGFTAKGITFPSGRDQAANARAAFRAAQVLPEVIGYVEAHGTGTVAGDSQELGGLYEVLYASAKDGAGEGLKVSPTAAEASSEVCEQMAEQHALLPRRIPIGSVKSVMGHAEGASGLMSLIKVLLMYEHKQLLPNQLFDYDPSDPNSTNPHAAIKDGYFEVVTTTEPWEPAPACISNYGFGGTNAFAIVAPGNVVTTAGFVPVDATGVMAATVACAASSQVSSAISDACTDVSAVSGTPYADGVAGSVCLRTSAEDASWVPSFGSQATSVADSSWFQEQSALGNDLFYAYRGGRKVTARPSQAKVVLVYSGQGSQWAEMGRVLVQSNAIFRDTIKRLDGYARKVDDTLRLWEWFSGEAEETGASELDTPAVPSKAVSWMDKSRSGLGITAYQVGLTNILQAVNLHPDFVLGHSLGEVGACYAADLQTEKQTIEIAIVRSGLSAYILPDTYMLKTRSCLDDSDLMRDGVVSALYNLATLTTLSAADADPCKEKFHFYYLHHVDKIPVEYVRAECGEMLFDLNGSMVAVGLEAAVIQQAIDELGLTQTCVACYNSPQGQTVSGAAPEVKRLKAHLEKQHKDLFWRDVPTDKVAYHAPHLTCHYDLLVSQFSAILGDAKKVVPANFVCTSTNIATPGVNDTPVLLDAHFHARNIVNPVYFQQALESLPKDTLIVEVGPHQGLLGQIKRVRSDFSTLGLIKANSPASELQVATALSKLFWEAGYNKHVYNPTKVNRATRLPLSQRHPDLWNHTRVQKTFDYTDFELMHVKSGGKGVSSSANSAASLTGGGFEVRYDVANEHKFLLDHCIQGQPLFPATGHLYTFWSAIGLDKGINIAEFEILQAVSLDPTVILAFAVHKTGNDFTITHEGNAVARAVIVVGQDGSPAAAVPVMSGADGTATIEPNRLLDGNSLYNHFKRYGYEYKTAFRLVKHRTLPASLRTVDDDSVVPAGSNVDGYAVLNTAMHVIAWLDVMLQLFLDDLRLLRLPTLLKRVHLRPSLLIAALKDQASIVYIDTPTKRLFNEHALFQELHTLPTTKARVPCRLVHSVQTFVPLGVHMLPDQSTLAQVENAANWMAVQLSAHLTVHPEQLTSKPWLQNVLQHASKRVAAMPAETMSLTDCETNPLSAIAAHVYADLESMLDNPLRCISLAPEHEIFYSRDDNRAFASPAGLLEQLVSLVAQEWEHSTQATKGLRVLEGGVGTGGLTRRLWPVLSPVLDTYTGMDVSAIVPGDEISRDKRFETLHHDLNDPLPALAEDQADQNYHLFCASNAIHVTKNIATTLRQLITRMHDGGYLLLEEFVDNDFCLYLWGLDPDIWSFPCSDAPRSYGLWMSWAEWQEVVAQVPELEIVVAVRTEVRLTLLLRYRSAGHKAATMAVENKHAWSDLSPAAAPAQRFVSDGALALFRTLAKEYSSITIHTATLDVSDSRSVEVFRSALVQCPLRHLAVHRQRSGAWVTTSAEAAACAMEASTDADADATADAAVDTVATSGLVTESNSALSLSIRRPGDLSSLAWVPLPLRLTASNQDSLVNVEFSGLNFKDVMYAFGKLRLETSSFGLEVSGHNLQGERVMGIGRCNCIATRTILDMTWKIPEQWSLADAATVPVVYLTALHAMFHKARLEPGQTMLVHGGAGGVGHAAIHLAQRHGIEVFTTCSQSKRAHLKQWFGLDDAHIGNSRDLTFVDLVLRGTNGQGVDMVLNCLSGAALNSSLTLVKEYGNFCEIGKFDLQTNTHIGLKVFERNVGYYAIDLATMFAHSHYSKVLVKLLQNALDNGDVRPLPYEVYAAVDAADALRYLSAGKQVGKVLIGMQNAAELASSSAAAVSSKSFKTMLPCTGRTVFTTTGTHVITGGLGGFGMELAHWLVQCGATRIVLTSRTGKLVTGWQQMRFASLQSNPLLEEVIISTLDVGDSVQCEQLISTYTADSSKPLRGVWHAAMVLEDVTFAKQTAERWANVHYAKSVACAYLDRACRSHAPALQVFCAFSSVVALQGNIGQAAYAHANAACEHVIQQRNADSLCGVAVQWGAIDNVGFVSQNATQVETSIAQYALQNIDDSLDCLHQWAQYTGVVSAYCELHQENTPAGNEGAVGVSVVEDIQAKFASILGGKAGDYDPGTPVQTYGLDSLSSTVLVNWINNNQMKGSAHGHITAEFFNDAMTIRKMFTHMTA